MYFVQLYLFVLHPSAVKMHKTAHNGDSMVVTLIKR